MRVMALLDFLKRFSEFLSPLLELARKFRGFLALVAFFVIALLFLVAFLLPEDNARLLLENFARLEPEQFYNFVLVTLLLFCGMFLVFTLLAHDIEGKNGKNILHVMVHEEGDATAPISGAEVTLTLEDAKCERTNERGGVAFTYGREWYDQECPINARCEGYEARQPLTVKLPSQQVYIPLKRAEPQVAEIVNPPAGEVFITYSDDDLHEAKAVAALLQEGGFSVWPVVHARRRVPGLGIQTEQVIRRSDFIIVLLSRAASRSADVRNEVAFALELRKPIIPVLLEPDAQAFPEIRDKPAVELYRGWDAGRASLFARLQEQDSAAASSVSPTALFTPKVEAMSAESNPFVYGSAVRDDLFVGRRQALSLISARIGGELQSVSVVANRRMGRTSLLNYVTRRYRQLFPAEHTWAVVYIDMMDVRAHTIAGIMRVLRRGIAQRLGRDLWDEKYDGSIGIMAEQFEELAEAQVRLVLCLDEWETVMAHSELDSLIEQLRSSGSMARLGMVVSTTHELSELTEQGGLSSPFYNIFETAYLGLMPAPEWEELVRKAFERGGREAEPRAMALVGELAGGHPYLTQLAGSLVWDAQDGGWEEAQIREQYRHRARVIFTNIWHRQSEAQKNVIRESLGIGSPTAEPKDVWDGLKRRGVLTQTGEVFCKPFADYVLSQEKD